MLNNISFSTILLIATCVTTPLLSADNKQPPSKHVVANSFNAFTGKIVGNRVRLRTQPDLDGTIIQELNKEDLLVVRGEDNEFYAVEPPKEIKGYVFRSYILDNIVEATNVNVRLEPSTDAPIIGKLNSGDKVEGTISTTNNKWLKIDLPKNVRFFVAKEYVQSVGRPELLETLQRRKTEVGNLLVSAYAFSQNEMRKPFETIQMNAIQNQFQYIIQNYSDFPDQVTKAKDTLKLIQDTYIQNKIAYLESKNREFSENYKQQLAALENKLSQDINNSPFASSEEELAPTPLSNLDAIRRWEPIEDQLFNQWLKSHPGKTKNDFYQDELHQAVTLKGTLEPYNSAVKNRPGDYLLKVNNLPVAFVYSTCINLSTVAGQVITLTGLKRPNNHFAYPAYFVISLQ